MGCLTEPSVELSSRNAPSRWTCYAQQEVEGRPRHVDEQPEGIKLGSWVENPIFHRARPAHVAEPNISDVYHPFFLLSFYWREAVRYDGQAGDAMGKTILCM
jgi:hypothetical protein